MSQDSDIGRFLREEVSGKTVVRERVSSDRELVFGDVLVRLNPSYTLAMRIDTDEANAANAKTGAKGYIDSIQDTD